MSTAKESESEAELCFMNNEAPITRFMFQEEGAKEHTGHKNERLHAAPEPYRGDTHNTIDWDRPEDPQNPMNWSSAKKITNIGTISILAFLSPLGSTITSPMSSDIMSTFGITNTTIEAFITSVYLLGYVFGPLLLAPLSEIYGRTIIYHICNFGFLIWTIACALSNNIVSLIIFRFLAGLSGSAPMTIGAGSIADTAPLHKRGLAMMGWIMGPVLGPAFGPLSRSRFSWNSGTPPRVISLHDFKKKTQRLKKETGNRSLRSSLDSGKDPKKLLRISIVRSLKMLLLLPIVTLLSLYMATMYGYQYPMFTTFPRVFEGTYGFSKSGIGLVYLGIGVGFLFALVLSAVLSDRLVKQLTKRNGGEPKPECRLPLLFVGAALAPIGLFLYGWTATKNIHWIVPIIGSAFLGAASFTIIMPSLAYLVDAYTPYAASATAAAIVSHSLLGALLPLAGNSMYDALGVGWGTSLLGFIAVAFAPIPLVFWKFGESIRTNGISNS
ncbi:unnamed protein product [Clonostachys rhizophaga]|uniref:Major facilitator superfamily (MFS) profile domain-containing protein n=1 Tax=Clonostachys rhizophaga TaxID=160324 RepID=A0A9N9YX40_9HYPO|nr:unnamed protein product [Clonostachys rhizophaga]